MAERPFTRRSSCRCLRLLAGRSARPLGISPAGTERSVEGGCVGGHGDGRAVGAPDPGLLRDLFDRAERDLSGFLADGEGPSGGPGQVPAVQGEFLQGDRGGEAAGISPGPNSVVPSYAPGSPQAAAARFADSATDAGDMSVAAASSGCGCLSAARTDEVRVPPRWSRSSATVNFSHGVRSPSWSPRIPEAVAATASAHSRMAVGSDCCCVFMSLSSPGRRSYCFSRD